MNPSQFFEAERVLAMRQRKGQPREYLVKWKNFDRAESSWQPERHLNKPLLESFRRPSVDAGEELQAYVRDLLCDELARCLNRPLQSRICLPCHHRVVFDIFKIRPVPINTKVWLDRGQFERAGFEQCIERTVNPLGHKRVIDFPVLLKVSLRRSPKSWAGDGQVIPGHCIPVFSLQFTKTHV